MFNLGYPTSGVRAIKFGHKWWFCKVWEWEEWSPSVCGGEEEEGLSVGICSLVQSSEKTDSSWVVRSCLISPLRNPWLYWWQQHWHWVFSILVGSRWDRIARCWSELPSLGYGYGPWGWGNWKGEGGVKTFCRKNDMDECDKGEEMNPME